MSNIVYRESTVECDNSKAIPLLNTDIMHWSVEIDTTNTTIKKRKLSIWEKIFGYAGTNWSIYQPCVNNVNGHIVTTLKLDSKKLYSVELHNNKGVVFAFNINVFLLPDFLQSEGKYAYSYMAINNVTLGTI